MSNRTVSTLFVTLFASMVAAAIATLGLRLALDASLLAHEFSGRGFEIGAAAVRAAGVAVLAIAQVVAIFGISRRGSIHSRGIKWLILIAATVATFATFAAVVLAFAGRA